MHSLRSNWRGARREGGSVSAAIRDRLSNEASGQFQRNPKGGMSFGRRRCCSLLTDPLRDMLWCPCGSTSRLASAQNPLPRMYSYFGDTTLEANPNLRVFPLRQPTKLAINRVLVPASHSWGRSYPLQPPNRIHPT